MLKTYTMKIAEDFKVADSLYHPKAQQVKIFNEKDPADAEKKINAWLMENKVFIHHVGQSQGERGGNFIFSISLFYSLPA